MSGRNWTTVGYEAPDVTSYYNATTTPEERYREFYLAAQFVTGLILYPIVCIFGLAGNSLNKVRAPTT